MEEEKVFKLKIHLLSETKGIIINYERITFKKLKDILDKNDIKTLKKNKWLYGEEYDFCINSSITKAIQENKYLELTFQD